jgi:hypothetical protein
MSTTTAPQPTAAFIRDIAAFVRAGGFAANASEALGIPAAVFAEWLRLAEQPGSRAEHRALREAVLTAAAQARLKAETEVFKKKPSVWLQRGPAKDRRDVPGWSLPPRPIEPEYREPNWFLSREGLALVGQLRDLLAPHPTILADFVGILRRCDAGVSAEQGQAHDGPAPV